MSWHAPLKEENEPVYNAGLYSKAGTQLPARSDYRERLCEMQTKNYLVEG